ncbi:MAG: hypothetical protein FWD57_00915, partial [Polyangiaceae bacterium]|nr:hypothetical protein [Polyangiaceae bacterium]
MLHTNGPRTLVPLRKPLSIQSLITNFGGTSTTPEVDIHNIATPEHATTKSLVPILHPRAAKKLNHAAAVLISIDLAHRITQQPTWVHPLPRFALAILLTTHSTTAETNPSISTHAIIEDGAIIGNNVSVGHGAVVLSGASIGDDCSIEPNAVIYGSVEIGNRVVIGAGAVIGRPGFGWAESHNGCPIRMPQLGGVSIG